MPDPARPAARTSAVHVAAVLGLAAAACGSASPGGKPAPAAGVTARLGDRAVTITFDGDRIAAVDAAAPGAQSAGWIVPGMIDSHVHLAFWPVAADLADRGIAAAVDLAAPIDAMGQAAPITVLASGPMITSPSGYPLSTWGPDGFGVGCEDKACVARTIDDLAARGARVIKVPIGEDGLDPGLVPVAVELAHARGLEVVAHALGADDAAIAARAGCDALAHTPVEPLAPDVIAAWKGRAVISSLAAFGGERSTVENLRRLRAAGAIVLYGTDLGNLRDAGPSPNELRLLVAAGLDGAAIVDAMTAAPAAFWGLDRLGAIAPGKEASFSVVAADPRVDPTTLASPREVWLRGAKRGAK